MGIRDFANVPCPTCGIDTMHRAMRCTICGTVSKTNTEARTTLFKRRLLNRKARGMSDQQALADMHRDDDKIAAEKRKQRKAIPLGALQSRGYR